MSIESMTATDRKAVSDSKGLSDAAHLGMNEGASLADPRRNTLLRKPLIEADLPEALDEIL